MQTVAAAQSAAAAQASEAGEPQHSQNVPPHFTPLSDADANFDSGFETESASALEDGLVGRTLEVDVMHPFLYMLHSRQQND